MNVLTESFMLPLLIYSSPSALRSFIRVASSNIDKLTLSIPFSRRTGTILLKFSISCAFDCSSFTQYLFASVGIEIPRSAILQAGDANGKELTIGGEFLPGDLLFMRSDVGHYKDGL